MTLEAEAMMGKKETDMQSCPVHREPKRKKIKILSLEKIKPNEMISVYLFMKLLSYMCRWRRFKILYRWKF